MRMGLFYYPLPVHMLNLFLNQVCLQIFIKFQALLAQSVNCKTTVPQAAITVISALIIVKHGYSETKVKVRTIAIPVTTPTGHPGMITSLSLNSSITSFRPKQHT